ncbi:MULTISPECIES: 3D domain-containing protein [unclassified Planococcus (in: firmicutes)]|uniref:3D domain-containing protein n=1 Tax=unclassified Planococcus (in: firmicutes) TaxID=2662419 RepID=UPI001E4D0CB0|nr:MULTISPECIES: 3D domain-containing protein [unclassified Planococcus (in: firmicutes)]
MKKLLAALGMAMLLLLGTSLTTSAASNVYTVKSGDTLYKISQQTKVSVTNLKSYNGLKSNLIFPKQQLKLKKTTAQTISKPSTPSSSKDKVVKEFTVSATAYTAYCKGCSGITRTGINLKKNPGLKVIAVDPKVIPLGSKVWVEGYGTAIAGDTGGAIKGKKIDVFIPTQSQALKWGRKNVKVKILK